MDLTLRLYSNKILLKVNMDDMRVGWPESYGFSIYGQGPSYVISVERNSIAHLAGICPGDQLIELDGFNVSVMSTEAIKTLARHSRSEPPGLGVASRVQFLELSADRRWGYGMTIKGIKPTLVATVDPPGPAYRAGIRPGQVFVIVDTCWYSYLFSIFHHFIM